jgi:Sulfotransferase domain
VTGATPGGAADGLTVEPAPSRRRPALAERMVAALYPTGSAKIFGIGLNKTGTRSLASALRQLGFRTLHRGDVATSDLVDRAIEEGRPPLELVGEQYEAYLDVSAIVRRFDVLDGAYAASRFVLTTSDRADWIESRRRHVLANVQRAERGEYDGPFLEIDEPAWVEEWEAHHAAVLRHFAGRPDDLLVMDVRAGDGWETLAPFLGVRVPRRAFPWENREGRGTYAGGGRLDRVARRSEAVVGIARRRGWWR